MKGGEGMPCNYMSITLLYRLLLCRGDNHVMSQDIRTSFSSGVHNYLRYVSSTDLLPFRLCCTAKDKRYGSADVDVVE